MEKKEIPEPTQKLESEAPGQQDVSAEQPKVEIPQAVQEGPGSKEINKDACMWAMFCHLAGLCALIPIVPVIGGVIGPLIIWQIKKNDNPFIDEQGKEAVNFQISILLYSLIGSVVSAITCVGIALIPIVVVIIGIFDIVFLIIASIKANNGKHYRYPLTFRFIK
jgi:uncharacterized Tic20 family protein